MKFQNFYPGKNVKFLPNLFINQFRAYVEQVPPFISYSSE
jgi:hypothetical protein